MYRKNNSKYLIWSACINNVGDFKYHRSCIEHIFPGSCSKSQVDITRTTLDSASHLKKAFYIQSVVGHQPQIVSSSSFLLMQNKSHGNNGNRHAELPSEIQKLFRIFIKKNRTSNGRTQGKKRYYLLPVWTRLANLNKKQKAKKDDEKVACSAFRAVILKYNPECKLVRN